MKKRVIILSAIFLIFCIQFAMAGDVNVKGVSIITKYAPNATITGKVNLSLGDISSSAYLKTNLGETIPLLDLIKKQSNFSYSCTTFNCSSIYSAAGSGSSSKQFNLIAKESKVFGFEIEGQVTSIPPDSKFSLNVTSDNATLSFVPQLSIDLLDDGSPEWASYKPSGIFFGTENYGCYDPADYTGDTVIITNTSVCERISLPISPDVTIETTLTEVSPGNSIMQMSITDKEMKIAPGTCQDNISSSGTVSCIPKIGNVNYPIKKEGDFFVCIKKISSDAGKYKIKTEHTSASSSKCGFYGTPSLNPAYGADYDILAASDSFDSVGSFILNDTETLNSWYHLSNLETGIANYLSKKYANNCTKGCIIPIRFTSGIEQNIDLSNFNLEVAIQAIGVQPFNSINDVEITPALINTTGYQSLSLTDANLSIPSGFGDHNFELILVDGKNNYTILSKTITTEKIPQIVSVNPTTTAGALSTEFTVNINTFGLNATIIQYKWNFGDGSPIQTTTTKTISHTYNQLGNFSLQITIYNSVGLNSTAQFPIYVVSPKDAATEIINQDLASISSIENKFASYPAFTQNALKQALNFDAISAQLQNLKAASTAAVSDAQYLSIMTELTKINLPDTVEETLSSAFTPFFPDKNNINLEVLKTIGGGTYDSARQSEYLDAIVLWGLDNIKMTTTDYSEFSGVYGETVAPLRSIVRINAGGITTGSAYLVIPDLQNIYFDSTYQKSGSYYYIPLSSNPQTVQFATSAALSPVDLPIFIAPSLSQISLPEEAAMDNTKMLIFGIVLASAIILGLTIYVIVGKWYQRKYESYLFKDRNDLYNIINYIHKSKSKGMRENEIEKNLGKARWTSEQIKYVMKRYAGKKIGILGFAKK